MFFRHRRILVLLFSIFLLFPVHTNAQTEALVVDVQEIRIKSTMGVSQPGATINILANEPVTNISITSTDLLDESDRNLSQPILLASQLNITPASLADLESGQFQQIHISVANVSSAGEWFGNINIQWQNNGNDEFYAIELPIFMSMQTQPSVEIFHPDTITVSGYRNTVDLLGDATKSTREVSIKVGGAGSPARGLVSVSSDLLNDDQSQAFPASAITTKILDANRQNTTEIEEGAHGTVLVEFNMDNVPSGTYSGDILIQSSNADTVSVPVTVNVKDPFCLPVVFLVLGVLISVVFSYYRQHLRPKDNVRAQVQFVRGKLQVDAGFGKYYQAKVTLLTTEIEDLLQQSLIDDAKIKVIELTQHWHNWQGNKGVLCTYIRHIMDLKADIEKSKETQQINYTFIEALYTKLQTTLIQEIPDYGSSPNTLKALLYDSSTDSGWKILWETTKTVHSKLTKLKNDSKAFNNTTQNGVIVDVEELQDLALESKLEDIDRQLKEISEIPSTTMITDILQEIKELEQSLKQIIERTLNAESNYKRLLLDMRQVLDKLDSTTVVETYPELFDRLRSFVMTHNASTQNLWVKSQLLAQNYFIAVASFDIINNSNKLIPDSANDAEKATIVTAQSNLVTTLQQDSIYTSELSQFKSIITPLLEELQKAIKDNTRKFLSIIIAEPSEQLLSSGLKGGSRPSYSVSPVIQTVIGELPDAHAVRSTLSQPWYRDPRTRLLAFQIVTFIVFSGILAAAGFVEVYSNDAVFGSNGFADYLKLFLWGFGVEASRTQIVGLAQNWNVIDQQ